MRLKRGLSLILAAAMTAGSFSMQMVSFAAEVSEATLRFATGLSASIVTGGAIDISITKPDYYVEDSEASPDGSTVRKNGLNIKKTSSYGDLAKIQVGGQDTSKILNIDDNFFSNPNTDAYTADLDISGAYKALLTKGSVVEQGVVYYYQLDNNNVPVIGSNGKPIVLSKSSTSSSSFTIDPQISVFTTSTVDLRCIDSEELGGRQPAFVLENKQGDAFSGFTTAIARPRVDDTKPLEVVFQDSGNQEYVVTLTPQTIQTMNESGDEFAGGTKKRLVQKGTVFTLSMPQAKSNNVLLKVYSPKAAADQISLDIKAQNGESGKQRFIQLADGDTLEFIRQNFRVAYDTEYFNTQFYLTWKWVPDDSSRYKDTVKFPTSAPSGFQTVQLDREYHDVEGEIHVDISCRLRANPVLTTVKIPVVIKGTGQPASLEAHSQQVSRDVLDPVTNRYEIETVEFTGNERKMRDFTIDAYDGHLAGVKQPEDPSAFTVRLNMGMDNASSLYAVVECSSGGKDLVTMKTTAQQGSSYITSDYSFGAQIANPYAEIIGGNEGVVDLTFLPNKIGTRDGKSTTVTIIFYVKDAKGNATPALVQPQPFRITVKDSSPNSDATLFKVKLLGQVPALIGHSSIDIDYNFNPTTYEYKVELENKYDQVVLEPTLNDIYYADKIIKVKATTGDGYVDGWGPSASDSGGPDGFFKPIRSGSRTPAIPLVENQTVQIQLLVTAEDTTTQLYKISVMRLPKSNDATLKSLTLTDSEGTVLFDGIQHNVFEYSVEIPFKVQKVKVGYETNNSMATAEFTPELEKETVFSEKVWLNILKGCAGSEGTRSMDFVVDLKAEEPTSTAKYTIHITRAEPSNVNTLKELKVLNASDGKDAALTMTPAFRAGMEMGEGDAFEVNTPFSTSKVKVSAKATDTGSTVILLAKGLSGGGILGENESGGDGWMILGENSASKAFTPTPFTDGQAETTFYMALVEVWPESMIPLTGTARPQKLGDRVGEITYEDYMTKVMRYPIQIYREPASNDASLLSIALSDQDKKPVEFLDFDPEKTDYSISVPYEVEKVAVTPTAVNSNVSKIEVNGRKVANGSTSALIKLEETATTITIKVTPEDTAAASKEYKLSITRSAPSNDALLVKLEVEGATDFKPVFAPKRTSYSAKVAEGAEGVKITATANHASAKITINDQRVESGKQSELIRILEVNQTITIVVTAQDGKTTMTYTIRFRNENLVQKSSNADLEDLEVTPGVMRPTSFKPAVTEYEVAVDEETFDVELFPEPADSMATMKVFLDSKEIGDDDDNYAAFIQEGENEFTIEVTSPDETKKKTYTIYVYRDEEDKMGKLTPVDAEEIDFENSPDVIIVDISRYARVNANVFEELRDYPDKKIIFQGNDYSLQFDASDINRITPNTDVFDFGMSFDSPLEEEIYDEIDSHSGNSRADPVLVSFNYHGELPGPAVLTLSLGKKYKSDTLYWHYYNEERERIDYYGTVKTNSKGTFSVILDHMSTYLVAKQRIAGSENKDTGLSSAERDLTAEAIEKKLIPNTGVKGEDPR